MGTWRSKHWGAVIGALLIVLISWLGIGVAALAILFGVIGYFIGSYLDGEFDLDDVRNRVQGNNNSNEL